jgi:glycosyltransferase involved in cell wall biosynthesis
MRLGVNAVRLTRPFTGVGRYLDNLLREWSAMPLPFADVVLYAPAAIEASRVSYPPGRFALDVAASGLPDPWWEWRSLGRRHREIDVLFSPSYTLPLGYRGPAAVTYFGPSTNPRGTYEWWRAQAYDRLHRASARQARLVFTASEAARRRVVEVYGVPESRVALTPLAAADTFRRVTDLAALDAVKRRYLGAIVPYVLFVGKMSGRHHVPRLIEAFAHARGATGLPHRLLLVGPEVVGVNVGARAREAGIEDVVVHGARVPEADLPALYSGADLFVFPATEAEGFGLPLLEAMACGAPVLSTALGSVPEVVGDAACLIHESTVDALKEGIVALLPSEARRDELRRRGFERVRRFSWRQTAERTMAALAALA